MSPSPAIAPVRTLALQRGLSSPGASALSDRSLSATPEIAAQNVEGGQPSLPLRASLPTSFPTAFFYLLDSSGHSRFVLRILIIRVSLSAFARARRYLGAAGGHPGFGRPSSLLRRRMRTPTRRGCDFPIALPGCTFRCGHSRFRGLCLDGSSAQSPR